MHSRWDFDSSDIIINNNNNNNNNKDDRDKTQDVPLGGGYAKIWGALKFLFNEQITETWNDVDKEQYVICEDIDIDV